MNTIPERSKQSYTHGHWEQPLVSEIVFVNEVAHMLQSAFDRLKEYIASCPSGVYEGKMWKARYTNDWLLAWYENASPNTCRVQTRKIAIVPMEWFQAIITKDTEILMEVQQ